MSVTIPSLDACFKENQKLSTLKLRSLLQLPESEEAGEKDLLHKIGSTKVYAHARSSREKYLHTVCTFLARGQGL